MNIFDGSAIRCDQSRFSLPRFHSGRAYRAGPRLFLTWAQRAGMRGIQEWLSFYFKCR